MDEVGASGYEMSSRQREKAWNSSSRLKHFAGDVLDFGLDESLSRDRNRFYVITGIITVI